MASRYRADAAGRPRTQVIRAVLPFWSLVAVGIALSAWHWAPQWDVVISAGAAVFLGLLSLVAIADLGLIGAGSRRSVEWLKAKPLSEVWDPLQPSLMGIAFFYGIIIGHFIWR